MSYDLGDEVKVIDTSNGKRLDGIVQRLPPNKVVVWVTKWRQSMEFVNGKTKLGRFKLQERGGE